MGGQFDLNPIENVCVLLKANGHEGQSRNYVCFFNSDIQMNSGPANYLSKENTEKSRKAS